MSSEIIAALIGLLGVVIGAIPTYLFMRQKNSAEVEKLKAEIEKLKAETDKIKAEAAKIRAASSPDQPKPKPVDESINLITCSDCVPIFTKGQSRLTATMMSNALIVDFRNDRTWSGIAFVFTPKLDVHEFARLGISGIATQQFTFQIEYKARLGGELKIVTSSSFQSFPATPLVSTISIPLRYDGKVDEITLMFYETGEASHVNIESIRLSN